MSEPVAPTTVIDISHESLMRVWGRLKTWTDAEARSARLYRRLAEDAKLHAEDHASPWRDPQLQFALDWQGRREPSSAWAELYGGRFDATMSFLERSRDMRDRALAEATFDRRWRTIGRIPIMLTAATILLIFVDQFFRSYSDRLAGLLSNFLAQYTSLSVRVVTDPIARAVAVLTVFTATGMPAVLTYIVLEHFGRSIYRRVAFDRILGEIADGARQRAQEATRAAEEPLEPDIALTMSYAPAAPRMLAGMIDGVASVVMFFLSIFFVAVVEGFVESVVYGQASDELSDTSAVIAVVVWVVLSFLYHAIPTSTENQATPGMRAAGIFLVSSSGRRLSFARAALRHLTKLLSYGPAGIGLLLQPFTARRQALHDMLSQSVVLLRPAGRDEPVPGVAPAPAPTGRRLVAFAVDWCIAAGLYLAIVGVVVRIVGLDEQKQVGAGASYAAAGAWLVLWCVYHGWMTSSAGQASVGMHAARIYVADPAGGRLSFARSAWRTFAKIPSYWTGVGVLIQPFTAKKQALHDILSRSVVLSGQPRAASAETREGDQAM